MCAREGLGPFRKMCVRMLFAAMMLGWAVVVLRELVSRQAELLAVLGGVAFFQLVNWGIEWKLVDVVPTSLAATFINTSVSLLHSALVSCSVGSSLVLGLWASGGCVRRMMSFDSLYYGTWPGAYSVLAFSCGYFAYDQVDMLRRQLYRQPSGVSLLVHHWLLLNCFTLALVRHASINYLVLTLICENHSVLLHWRRVGRMTGLRRAGTRYLVLEWLLNWATFLFSRVLVHLAISVKLYLDASNFSSKFELALAASGMLGLNILNCFLGVDLLSACKRELGKKGSSGNTRPSSSKAVSKRQGRQ